MSSLPGTSQIPAGTIRPWVEVVSENKLTRCGQMLYKLSKSAEDVLRQMTWTDEDVVMDIGCGNGYKTVYVIIPIIEKYKMFLSIDRNPEAIEFAKSECRAEKLEYHRADIEQISSFPKRRHGTTTRIISFDCLHCLENERLAFQNIMILLAPAGEAFFEYRTTDPLLEVCHYMANQPGSKKYLKDMVQCFQDRLNHKLSSENFRKMLEETGFEILYYEETSEMLTYRNDDEFRKLWKNVSGLMTKIPNEFRDEFIENALQTVVKIHGRNVHEEPAIKYRRLLLRLKKPKV